MYHTIVVTGGAGFIGSNFIHHIIKKHGDSIQVVNLDKLTYAGNLENLKDVENLPNYHFVNADICDGEAVTKILDTYNPDAVINFAAETHVDRSITDPGVFARTNVMGTLNLLNCCMAKWMDKDGNWCGEAICVAINHPDRIIRKPRFTEQEVEDAKTIKRMFGDGNFTHIRKDEDGICEMMDGPGDDPNVGWCAISMEEGMFPSIRPGETVTLDEIIGGAE